MKLPSIFNDVIGPVMRGPSSSHTAASWRVANLTQQFLGDTLQNATIAFDPDGAWTTNYEEQGTVLGIDGGLLNVDMTHENMKVLPAIAQQRGISIQYELRSFKNDHPNSMLLHVSSGSGNTILVRAASLGGGSFEIRQIDDFELAIKGDRYVMLIWSDSNLEQPLQDNLPANAIFSWVEKGHAFLGVLESAEPFKQKYVDQVKQLQHEKIALADPVMPVVSGNETPLPFSDIASLITYGNKYNMSIGEIGLLYEQCRSGLEKKELLAKMDELIRLIELSIQKGLEGTVYADRILHQQSHLIKEAADSGKIINDTIFNTIIANVAAIMEAKSSLEVIVANPTAGSCGAVGGVLKAVSDKINASNEQKIMAYFAAGIVGVYFAMGPGFSAEEHGCQVECGASAGMAAAGIVQLQRGTVEQALGAASLAIQNMIGLVCDPIADRVEAPCLGKNTSAAVNAMASATMSLSGFEHLIPLDQVIATVAKVSCQMPTCVKCTGLGGLAITQAAQDIKARLK